MPKISACIISLNEGTRIEGCLESLVGVVDEVILVDSGSTDDTVAIAERHGVRIIHQEWLGMGAQKALAYSLARHDWILNLDCDERLTQELAESITEALGQQPQHSAFEMPRKSFYIYRWLDHCWYPEWRTRLFDRRSCEVRGVDPHEHVEVLQGTTGQLSGDLQHYSFASLSDHLQTVDRYTTISAQRLIDEGRRVSILTPLTRGAWTFFKLLVIKRAFLDGLAGICVALLSGIHSFLKYAKVLTAAWKAS